MISGLFYYLLYTYYFLAKVLNNLATKYIKEGLIVPDKIVIHRCIRKEPVTREDYVLRELKKLGIIPTKEKEVYDLPKAPGVFSLGPDIEPLQVPNSESVQPVTKTLDVRNLRSIKESMKGLF